MVQIAATNGFAGGTGGVPTACPRTFESKSDSVIFAMTRLPTSTPT